MKKSKRLSLALILAFTSIEASTLQEDDIYQWILKDNGDYKFSNNFSATLENNKGKSVIGINSTKNQNNIYTLEQNFNATFNIISNTNSSNDVSQVYKNAYGIYSEGNTTLNLLQSSHLSFRKISSADATAYGIYSKSGGIHTTLQASSKLSFDSIQGKDSAYGFWSFFTGNNTFSLHPSSVIRFETISATGDTDTEINTEAIGINSINSGSDTFQALNGEKEGGIIAFGDIQAKKAFVINVSDKALQGKEIASFDRVRVYYGDYTSFDNSGNRSALYANIDDSRNGNLNFGLATIPKESGMMPPALITTSKAAYDAFDKQKDSSRWLIAPSDSEIYGMYFSSSAQKRSLIAIVSYLSEIKPLSISTQGFGETSSAKQTTLIYASGNLTLDLSQVSFINGKNQGAAINATNTAIGVLVDSFNSSSPTIINFKGGEKTFSTIMGKEAYGLVLQNNAKANISKLAFGTITGSEKSVGIAFEGSASLSGNITFANTPSTALQIHSGAKASILGSIVFKNPQNPTSLIDNQGELDLLSSARLTFGEIPSSDIDAQKIETGIRNVYTTEIGLNLGNIHIQTQATKEGAEAYGIFSAANASTRLTLDKSKTLTFDIKKQNGNEGIAFGRGKDTQNNKGAIHLTLSQNSNLIFNSNAGELDSLSGNGANISLAGNKSRISSSSLQLHSLSVEDFKLSNSTITLFASQEANISSNGFAEGKAYNQDKTQAQSGGSDRIVIGSSTSGQTLNNTLALTMDTFSKSQTYAILAQVGSSAKDTVVFNNLKNGESTTIKAYAGFESADITLKRTDSNGDAYYYIDFSPANVQVNQDYIAPTISAMLSNYTLYLANFNSLNKRMGELRDNHKEQGVWARVFGGELSNEFGSGSADYYATLQAGYDYGFSLQNAQNYLGFALAYIYSNNQVNSSDIMIGNDHLNGSTDSKTHGIELGVYNSYIQDNGFYTDSIFKFSYLSSNFDLFNQTSGSDIDNLSIILSQEVGYRYDFSDAKGLYLTPSIELAFGYLNGTDFTQTLTTPNQTQHTLYSHQDDIFITRGKIEATLGYFFATDFGMSTESVSEKGASLYLGLGYEYDYVSGGNITYKVNQNSSSAQSSAIGSDGRMVLNLGSNILLNDTVRMYFDFEKNFFGKIDKEYQINAGIRIGLGEEKILQPQKEEESAPLKIEE